MRTAVNRTTKEIDKPAVTSTGRPRKVALSKSDVIPCPLGQSRPELGGWRRTGGGSRSGAAMCAFPAVWRAPERSWCLRGTGTRGGSRAIKHAGWDRFLVEANTEGGKRRTPQGDGWRCSDTATALEWPIPGLLLPVDEGPQAGPGPRLIERRTGLQDT